MRTRPPALLCSPVQLTRDRLSSFRPAQSGDMFNRPTDCAVNPKTGDIFVADGYGVLFFFDVQIRVLPSVPWQSTERRRWAGNSRVHRFAADGTHIMSWGESGTDEGQFYCPHNIDVTPDGERVLVADRENSRVSVYTTGGELLDNWPAGHRPAGLCVGRGATAGLVFVAEQGLRMEFGGCAPRLRHALSTAVAALAC